MLKLEITEHHTITVTGWAFSIDHRHSGPVCDLTSSRRFASSCMATDFSKLYPRAYQAEIWFVQSKPICGSLCILPPRDSSTWAVQHMSDAYSKVYSQWKHFQGKCDFLDWQTSLLLLPVCGNVSQVTGVCPVSGLPRFRDMLAYCKWMRLGDGRGRQFSLVALPLEQ